MNKIFHKDIKGILFDMDGVVIDSEKLYSQSETQLLSKYGVKFDDSDWLLIKGCTEKQFYDFVYDKFQLEIPRDILMQEGKQFLKDIFTKELQYMAGFNDVYPLLKNKYNIALVTSTGPELVNHVDSLLSVVSKFDLLITSADVAKHKPNPEPYLMAMNRLQLKPYECIVIEDSIQGIKAGKAAGCYVIALEGSLDKIFLDKADYIVSSFDVLKKLILKN